jgi:hypothetical protein
MIYLAVPYSHDDPAVREQRFKAVSKAAHTLMQDGKLVFSPINHSHYLAETYKMPAGWEYWEKFDRKILSICDEFYVLCLDGWEESVGVQAEIRVAKQLRIPVSYIFEAETV